MQAAIADGSCQATLKEHQHQHFGNLNRFFRKNAIKDEHAFFGRETVLGQKDFHQPRFPRAADGSHQIGTARGNAGAVVHRYLGAVAAFSNEAPSSFALLVPDFC